MIGLRGATPTCALKEPLDPEQVSALARAFLSYLNVLFADSFEAQREGVEIEELRRLWALEGPRMEA